MLSESGQARSLEHGSVSWLRGPWLLTAGTAASEVTSRRVSLIRQTNRPAPSRTPCPPARCCVASPHLGTLGT